MKRIAAICCTAVAALSVFSPVATADTCYADINESLWEYECVTELNRADILPDADIFCGNSDELRGNVALYLYNFYLACGGTPQISEAVFDDVPLDCEYGTAVCWAAKNSVMDGIIPNEFGPYSAIKREELCKVMIRFSEFMGIPLYKTAEPEQFVDSLSVSAALRSYVAECKMAGIITGGADGYFRPDENVKKSECAAIIYRMYNAKNALPAEGKELVGTGEHEYDYLYESYSPAPHDTIVPASEPVDDAWFNNAVFIGDSVTEGLRLYRGSLLGGAKFVSAGSLSASNILSGQLLPMYQGKKVSPAEGVRLSGAKNVYIMLGMNNIGFGITRATGDMVTVIDDILALNPNVNIIIESVTPMTNTSSRAGTNFNNDVIGQYNQAMLEICKERGWYYVNVSEGVSNSEGYLRQEYCSDSRAMGMHFNSTGVKAWVEYLKTHVPAELKQ